jgi:hypothetical protein
VLEVQAGNKFGFTWTNQGVIDYEPAAYTNYFYHTPNEYNVGETTAVMTDTHGKRIYSLQVEFMTCGPYGARAGPCRTYFTYVFTSDPVIYGAQKTLKNMHS